MGSRIYEEKRGNGWKENRLQEVQDKRTDPDINVKSINAASDVAGRDVVIYMTALISAD